MKFESYKFEIPHNISEQISIHSFESTVYNFTMSEMVASPHVTIHLGGQFSDDGDVISCPAKFYYPGYYNNAFNDDNSPGCYVTNFVTGLVFLFCAKWLYVQSAGKLQYEMPFSRNVSFFLGWYFFLQALSYFAAGANHMLVTFTDAFAGVWFVSMALSTLSIPDAIASAIALQTTSHHSLFTVEFALFCTITLAALVSFSLLTDTYEAYAEIGNATAELGVTFCYVLHAVLLLVLLFRSHIASTAGRTKKYKFVF